MLRCQSKAFLKVRAFGNWHMFQTQPKNHQFFFEISRIKQIRKISHTIFSLLTDQYIYNKTVSVIRRLLQCSSFQPLPSGGAVSFGPLFQRCHFKALFLSSSYSFILRPAPALTSTASCLLSVRLHCRMFLTSSTSSLWGNLILTYQRPVQASPDRSRQVQTVALFESELHQNSGNGACNKEIKNL